MLTQPKHDVENPAVPPALAVPLVPPSTQTTKPTTMPQQQPPTAATVTAPPPPTNVPAAATAAAAEDERHVNFITLLDWERLNLLLVFFSFVVLVAACLVENRGSLENYQIGVGAASFGISFITALVCIHGKIENEYVKFGLGTFHFLWWVAGVIVLTFLGSFTTTTTAMGYFGSWFAFIFASLMFISVVPFFEYHVDKEMHSPRKPLWLLMASSAVVMGASIGPCSPQPNCLGYNAWALSMSVFSLFMSIMMFLLSGRLGAASMAFIAKFLILWWCVGALVVTFGAPFSSAGNGFFGSYAALIASILLLQSCV